MGWMVLVYLGSLVILLLGAFWDQTPFTGRVVPFDWSLDAFGDLFGAEVYRTDRAADDRDRHPGDPDRRRPRLPDRLLHGAHRVAPDAAAPGRGGGHAALGGVPGQDLRVAHDPAGERRAGLGCWRHLGFDGPGLVEVANSWIVFTYLWLPYMILPIYAGLERIPSSLLEASADLGGRAGVTFRRVILPLVLPAVVAGSIFTFSLTLGDYIVPDLVSDTKFIGNIIYDNSTLGNVPLAAAYALLPIVIVIGYLLVARRLGAFESL